MKKEYKELETELVHFDYGTEVNTCELVECFHEAPCPFGCRIDGTPICICDNGSVILPPCKADIIHVSG